MTKVFIDFGNHHFVTFVAYMFSLNLYNYSMRINHYLEPYHHPVPASIHPQTKLTAELESKSIPPPILFTPFTLCVEIR